jgi:hypothetical protein
MGYCRIEAPIPRIPTAIESIRCLSSTPTAAARCCTWAPPAATSAPPPLTDRACHTLTPPPPLPGRACHHLDLEPHQRAQPIQSSGNELIDLLLRQRAHRSTPLHWYFSSFPPLRDDSVSPFSPLSNPRTFTLGAEHLDGSKGRDLHELRIHQRCRSVLAMSTGVSDLKAPLSFVPSFPFLVMSTLEICGPIFPDLKVSDCLHDSHVIFVQRVAAAA